MVNIVVSTAQLLLALGLVVLNGFFVAAEFAFVRVRATSVEQLAADGKTGAGALQNVMADLDDYLAVTQLGITIASLGLGWVGEPAIASLLEPVVGPLLPAQLVHLVAFGVGFSIITFLHVVFGELAPKTLAIAQAERLALLVSPPMRLFYLLFYPGIVVFNGAANGFTRLLGVPPASESDETLGEREIRRVLSQSGEKGMIDQDEVAMIDQVFELDDRVVREVMRPRPDVVSVAADAPLDAVRETVLDAQHTRYPVVAADDPDEVVGFLDVKDLLRAAETGEGTTAGDVAREILVVPETKTVDDLLGEFQTDHTQLAAVVDEWGAFEGIVTVEDAVEIVVGNLRDVFDTADGEPSIRDRADGYEIDGGVSLPVASDTLGITFDEDGVETIGGLVLARLDRVPESGDRVSIDGYTFEVTGVDGARVLTVRVHESEAGSGQPNDGSDQLRDESGKPTDDEAL